VTTIEAGAFSECTGLTSINIPNSVTNISGGHDFGQGPVQLGAFAYCSGLTSVTISNSSTKIGTYAFDGCTSLTDVRTGDGVIFFSRSTCPQGPATIPKTINGLPVVRIGWNAFSGCTNLTSVSIPDTVTSIEYLAFSWCTSLTSVTIPNSVSNLGDGAFYDCTSLTNVTIPDSVTSIGDNAFCGCISLTNVAIGNNVTRIGCSAFAWCGSLTSFTAPRSVRSIGSLAFGNCISLTGIYFPADAPYYTETADYGPPFVGDNVTVYYLPGTIGWGTNYAGRPTAPWVLLYPLILSKSPSFGIQTNGFGFRISWATNKSVVVEASPSLVNQVYSPQQTNTLINGWSDFSDPQWANYPARFYRVRSL